MYNVVQCKAEEKHSCVEELTIKNAVNKSKMHLIQDKADFQW